MRGEPFKFPAAQRLGDMAAGITERSMAMNSETIGEAVMKHKRNKPMTLSTAMETFGLSRAVTVNRAGCTIIVHRNGMPRAYAYSQKREDRLNQIYHGTNARLFYANLYLWTMLA